MYYKTTSDYRVGDTEDWVIETISEVDLARLLIAGVEIVPWKKVCTKENRAKQYHQMCDVYYAGGSVKEWLLTHEFFDDSRFWYDDGKFPLYDLAVEYDWGNWHFVETGRTLIRFTKNKPSVRLTPVLTFSSVNPYTEDGCPRVFSGEELRRFARKELNDCLPEVEDDESFIVFHSGDFSKYLNLQRWKFYRNYTLGSTRAATGAIGYK